MSESRTDQGKAVEPGSGDPKGSSTIVVGVIGALAVFVLIVAVQAFFYSSEEALVADKAHSQAPLELSKLRASQQEVLHGYRWVDAARGVVAIPISRAMELTVRDLAARPSGPAVPKATVPKPAGAGNGKKR